MKKVMKMVATTMGGDEEKNEGEDTEGKEAGERRGRRTRTENGDKDDYKKQ